MEGNRNRELSEVSEEKRLTAEPYDQEALESYDKLFQDDILPESLSRYRDGPQAESSYNDTESPQQIFDRLMGDQDLPRKLEQNEAEISTSFERTISSVSELKEMEPDLMDSKPPRSPNLWKWISNGGTLKISKVEGHIVWTYSDAEGRTVSYVDGWVVFPPESKHPIIQDCQMERFTGDRIEDKRLYLAWLERTYGLKEIPAGYALHHDSKNGTLQLVRADYHSIFTHVGGHSMYKEENLC